MSCETSALAVNAPLWEKAYTENFASLCARARRTLTKGNSFAAEDAVSDAFLRISSKNPDAITSPASYWWTTIKRVWLDQQTGLSVSNTDYLEDMSPEAVENLAAVRVEPEVIKNLEREESWRAMRLKLGPLTLTEQKLVRGRLEGYSFEEIAAQLGEDVKRTRFRWYKLRARQRCRMSKDSGSRGA